MVVPGWKTTPFRLVPVAGEAPLLAEYVTEATEQLSAPDGFQAVPEWV